MLRTSRAPGNDKPTLSVVCVWQVAEHPLMPRHDFTTEYVQRMAASVVKHLDMAHRFVCLTDYDGRMPVPTARLREGWPGWWAKMELFRFQGPILYFDLDVVIIGDITPLARAVMESTSDILLVKNPMDEAAPLTSLIMGWRGDVEHIYTGFKSAGGKFTAEPALSPSFNGWRGDADFIISHVRATRMATDVAQNYVSIVSYKKMLQRGGLIPAGTAAVAFHGYPRPHEVDWMLRLEARP